MRVIPIGISVSLRHPRDIATIAAYCTGTGIVQLGHYIMRACSSLNYLLLAVCIQASVLGSCRLEFFESVDGQVYYSAAEEEVKRAV